MDKIYKKIYKHRNFIIVSLITILAVILRIIAAKNYGMVWFDELYSWDYANQDSILKTITTSLKEDVHMPLYFILLHIWIKLFGDVSETMRYLTLVLTVPLIPFIYIAGKNIFNRTTGYLASIFVCLSSFCIYYSVEIRFYGLVFFLSLLCTYFHTLYIDNFSAKDKKLYITFHTLLNYTFPYGILYSVILMFCGLVYNHKNKQNIIELIKTYLIATLFSIGAFIIVIYNVFALKHNIFSFQLDNFKFSFGVIFDIIENFFSASNTKIIALDFSNFKAIGDYFDSAQSFTLVFIPMLLGIFFTIKSIFAKNQKALIFLLPSFIFIILLIVLGCFEITSIQLRYFCIIYPIIILSMCYGFSTLKNKIFAYSLFFIMLQLNFIYTILQNRTVYSIERHDNEQIRFCARSVWNVKDDDLIIAPFAGKKLYYYIKKGKFIDFSINEALVLKNKKSGLFYFGDDFNKLNRNNIMDYLAHDAFNDIPQKTYEDNLIKIFNKMDKGQRFFVLVFYENLMPNPKDRGIDENNYKSADMLPFVIAKALRDTAIISEKHLKYIENKNDYCDIRVFEKP